MEKQLKIIPLKDLNLTNRFLFDEVMEDMESTDILLSQDARRCRN